ncbi:MAG: 4Fe-4S dicluster domain-containing protein [Gemmatimonadota bacterium]|nr:MAG: 4Fe-4S dicluster domain-containing protein [Gemmatimonadota bacterium]
MDRRDYLKTMCVAAGSTLVGKNLAAQVTESGPAAPEQMAVLVDTTRCLGCRLCEFACAKANGLPEPDPDVDITVARNTSPSQWSVCTRYDTEKGSVAVKRQCMHCLQPACISACLTKAMHKTPDGAVAWDGDKCLGCRFCMISCPFDVPKFEYDSPNPKIQKCVMCWERLQEGKKPACVENCPAGALKFGKRSELLEEAKLRIYQNPDKYVHHIYGEHEAGGTSFLYLASVPFEQLGFPTNLDSTPYPEYTKEFLYAVPLVLTLLPPLLLAINKATGGEHEEAEEHSIIESEVR